MFTEHGQKYPVINNVKSDKFKNLSNRKYDSEEKRH